MTAWNKGYGSSPAALRSAEPLPRVISAPQKPGVMLPTGNDSEDAGDLESIDPSGLEDSSDQADATAPALPAKAKPRTAPRAPKFLSALNLMDGTMPLADFVTEKDPKDTQEKYIVICQWFKEHLATEEISMDHIFTAYKLLGWQAQLPPDVSQPLKDLKYRKNWLDMGARGFFKINWSGTNHVNKMGVAPEK